jgi:uncharacterized protein (TIGR04255 family)
MYDQLPRPPIQEAIFDFRLSFVTPPSRSDFSALSDALRTKYPHQEDLSRHRLQLTIESGNSHTSQASAFAGIKFQSEDKTFVFQAQTDGFTLSKLPPYQSWEDLIEEAKEIWLHYAKFMKPQSVHRVACRYINQFEVAVGSFELSEYLVSAPEIPSGLPQAVNRYFLQQEIPAGDGAVVILTHALQPSTPATVAFILDVDVFKNSTYDVGKEEWWQDLEALRILKNQFFFMSITEKTKELFI